LTIERELLEPMLNKMLIVVEARLSHCFGEGAN
jgi:hypothetical protein